jgi:REP element-mobilizing transposase RayT
MARSPRITLPAYPHHIIQRGNNRAATFFAHDDYDFFLECLGHAKAKSRCRIHAYVLMTNHFHLLVEPAEVVDLDRFMQSVGRRYVRHVHETYGRTGTLWEGRLKSAVPCSGHGFKHSAAIGEALAEQVIAGRTPENNYRVRAKRDCVLKINPRTCIDFQWQLLADSNQ